MKFQPENLQSPSEAIINTRWMHASNARDGKAKAVVHICHGMSEHSGRYERFATFLARQGYHSVAHDHRGHGMTTAPDAPQGRFAKKNGWQKVIEDVNAVNTEVRERHAGLPIVYFGHSMGSIIGLGYCIRHSDKIAASALWNSGVDGGVLLFVYGILLKIERMMKGSDVPSQIAKRLAFDDWNKKFAPNRTRSDWLSRDETEVDKYLADPLCGFDATNSLWGDLLTGIRTGADNMQVARIRNDLPMHLLAGGQDPCSDNGKAVKRLYDRLTQSGIEDITYRHYDENRHEALNELNRDKVMTDFVEWLDKRFA